MKAIWNNTIIAEAPKEDLIFIEGNWYFPPSTINRQYYTDSSTQSTCVWKGDASYYTIDVEGSINQDAAWYYPSPKIKCYSTSKK